MNLIACTVDFLPCPEQSQTLYSISELIVSAIEQIDASEMALAYAFGAGSVLTWWSLGFAISAAVSAVRKA